MFQKLLNTSTPVLDQSEHTEQAVNHQKVSPVKETTKINRATPFKGIIDKKFSNKLEKYVLENPKKFKIYSDGTFDSHVKGRRIKNSNLNHVLEYLTGDRSSTTKGFTFLFSRLSKDPVVIDMIHKTRGEVSTESSSENTDKSSTNKSSVGDEESSASDEESSATQSGMGKRKKRVLVKVINSPVRIKNKFVPKIWEKL